MSIALSHICLTVVVTMPSAAEFSVLIGVDGWVKPSSWSVIFRGTTVYPLYNSLPNSAPDADTTTCLRILPSVWIGPFAGGGKVRAFFGTIGSDVS